MANAVFIQNPRSIYKDEPGVRYHFPKMYLSRVQACVGDWVVFYEGKAGVLGYTAVQKVREVIPDPETDGHYFAVLERDTLWQFEQVVPRNNPLGRAWEHSLRGADGRAMSGGYAVSAVRGVSFEEFSEIVQAGLHPLSGPEALPREADPPGVVAGGFGEASQPFVYPGLSDLRSEVLTSRKARDQSFARMVKAAYKGRCAISGLDLRNGLGRAEVQAAHIRPVKLDGPDVVPNGLALSATLHWMFDRGLISVGPEHEILVSDNKVSPDVRRRLISPSERLHLPDNSRDHPHPEYLRFHRENIFGAAA
ncbi:HNH endonuclease [Alisedimentitalea sp. MJ-SS2]|uniref:HNH endonuclease n=1 Tax=Aliisedimentitalea sp. MJ-SS2 TaxID=3049795 RepID=UPI0029087A54|nr:HNH endonuclease [Alisedimentitalea sp. MJ-SS2]MDU8927600.1 HNH endonuclease [Alisedimentitalea sp. MJ-SS2]